MNAALLLVAVMVPLLGANSAQDVEDTELRPWGCRTCYIPSDTRTAQPVDRDL